MSDSSVCGGGSPTCKRIFIVRHAERLDHIDPTWAPTASRPQDSPLSEEGVKQARRLGKWLFGRGVTRILSSPFIRTVQTADMIAQMIELDQQEDPTTTLPTRRKAIGIEEGICESPSWILGTDNRTGQPFFLRAGDFSAISHHIDLEYKTQRPVILEQNGKCLNGAPIEEKLVFGRRQQSDKVADFNKQPYRIAFNRRCWEAADGIVRDTSNIDQTVLLVTHGATTQALHHAFLPGVSLPDYDDEFCGQSTDYTCCTEIVWSESEGKWQLVGQLFSMAHDAEIAKRRKIMGLRF